MVMSKKISFKRHLLLSGIIDENRVEFKQSFEAYDLQSFSSDISLQDYQVAALENALVSLNLYMDSKRLYKIYTQRHKNLEQDKINRASFGMSTGRGKSIVMIKLLSLLGKAIREKKIPNKPIMLLAPNDTI